MDRKDIRNGDAASAATPKKRSTCETCGTVGPLILYTKRCSACAERAAQRAAEEAGWTFGGTGVTPGSVQDH